MGRKKAAKSVMASKQRKRVICRGTSIPKDIPSVYVKRHTSSTKVKLLDAALYKQHKGLVLSKTESRTLDEVAGKSMTYREDQGVHVFRCDKIPQSLNDRDNARWFMKAQYQAVWDGIVLKMVDSSQNRFPLRGPMVLVYQSYRKRVLDMDNNAAGVKSIIDAFVHMGVIEDDSEKHIYEYLPLRPIKSSEQHIELRLIPVEYGSELLHSIRAPNGVVTRIPTVFVSESLGRFGSIMDP